MSGGEDILARRRRLLGEGVPTFYGGRSRSSGARACWLWDAEGREYLDCYNNVPHVGHCHPRVVEAIAEQSATLNTHTRYLHRGILDYVERLRRRCGRPDPGDHGLHRVRGQRRGAAHGAGGDRASAGSSPPTTPITATPTPTSQLSLAPPADRRRAGHVRLIPAPDRSRRWAAASMGSPRPSPGRCAAAIVDLEESGFGLSALILCPVFANEGLPDLGPGFLTPPWRWCGGARGLLIVDEVQPGFGRMGRRCGGTRPWAWRPTSSPWASRWAMATRCAAVVARPEVMAEFREAIGYFNTFGGNPVAMAAATRRARRDRGRGAGRATRAKTGGTMLKGLQGLSHPAIAEVRGRGLFFGVELARDGQPDGGRGRRRW